MARELHKFKMVFWAKLIFIVIAVTNLLLVIRGIPGLWFYFSRILLRNESVATKPPYFRLVFTGMIVFNLSVMIALVATSIGLLRLRVRAVVWYCAVVVAFLVYDFTITMFWTSSGGLASSVGAATGVGNLGIFPFETATILDTSYPIVSAVLLIVAKAFGKKTQEPEFTELALSSDEQSAQRG